MNNIKTLNVRIIKEDPKKIDLNSFARFIIGDIHDMDEFNLPQYLHIAVLNYGCNLCYRSWLIYFWCGPGKGDVE